MDLLLVKFTNDFDWESEVQKLSFLNFISFLRKNRGDTLSMPTTLLACYIFQKTHESNLWWNDRVAQVSEIHAEQVRELCRTIERLSSDVSELKDEVVRLRGRNN